MIGFPKILIFDCCRGSEVNLGELKISSPLRIPFGSDLFIGFATSKGFTSSTGWAGSPFVEAFCSCIEASYDKESFIHIFQDVQESVSKQKTRVLEETNNVILEAVQIPESRSTLRKHFYLLSTEELEILQNNKMKMAARCEALEKKIVKLQQENVQLRKIHPTTQQNKGWKEEKSEEVMKRQFEPHPNSVGNYVCDCYVCKGVDPPRNPRPVPDIDKLEDKYGDTALVTAIENHSYDKVKKLLYDGANPNIIPLSRILYVLLFRPKEDERRSKIEIIKLLISYGANFNALLPHFGSVLHYNTAIGYDLKTFEIFEIIEDVIRILVHHGADINALDDKHDTPLHKAATYGQAEYCRLLLELGADPTIRNKENKTALDLVQTSSYFFHEQERKRITDILTNGK